MTHTIDHPTNEPRRAPGPQAPRRLLSRRLARWTPLALVVLSGLLLALATALDAGSGGSRDAALLIGSSALYLLLPLAAVSAVIVLTATVRRTSGSRTDRCGR